MAGEGRWKLCACTEAWEAPLSSISPSSPGVRWSFILTSSLLDRTWKEVSRRLARGWEICWMRENQESRGCPAQGGERGGGWERPQVSQGSGQASRAATSQALGHVCALGHLGNFLPHSLPSPQLRFIQVLQNQRLRQSLWLSCDKARDTPRDCVEQPKISSAGTQFKGKDVTFNPCCPLAVLVTGTFIPGNPSTWEGLWSTDLLPARSHLALLVAPRTSFEE